MTEPAAVLSNAVTLQWAPAASFSLSLALVCYGSVKWIKPLLRGTEPEQMIREQCLLLKQNHIMLIMYVCVC